jgi:hypothetical protein
VRYTYLLLGFIEQHHGIENSRKSSGKFHTWVKKRLSKMSGQGQLATAIYQSRRIRFSEVRIFISLFEKL